MANADRAARGEVEDHAPVVGSDGRPVGTVDRVEGAFIKLARSDDAWGGRHRWLPRSTVAGTEEGVVRLSMPAAQAEEACLTEHEVAERLSLDPDSARDFGRPVDDRPHGSRAHAHGGPKGQREHGQSGQAPGPGGETSFGVDRPV